MDDRAALKIHGYINSDYDSSSDDSPSDFDDLYYSLKPPSIPFHELERDLITIEACKSEISIIESPWITPTPLLINTSEIYLKHFPCLPKVRGSLTHKLSKENSLQNECKDPVNNKNFVKEDINLDVVKPVKSNVVQNVIETNKLPKSDKVTLKKQEYNLVKGPKLCNSISKVYSCNYKNPVLERTTKTLRKIKSAADIVTSETFIIPNIQPVSKLNTYIVTSETFVIPNIQSVPKQNTKITDTLKNSRSNINIKTLKDYINNYRSSVIPIRINLCKTHNKMFLLLVPFIFFLIFYVFIMPIMFLCNI